MVFLTEKLENCCELKAIENMPFTRQMNGTNGKGDMMVHRIKKSKWVKVGVVGVDSGTLLLADPAYLQKPAEIPSYDELVGLKKSKRVVPTVGKRKTPKEWTPVMRATASQILYKKGLAGGLKGKKGAGVVTRTGWGDGLYPVFAEIGKTGDEKGRVKSIAVRFI